MVTDTRLRELVAPLRPRARAGGVGRRAARPSRRSTTIVREHGIDCGFGWVDGYLHAPHRAPAGGDGRTLRRRRGAGGGARASTRTFVERRAVWSAGRASASTDRRASIRASISPALARAVVAAGGRIYEHSAVEEFSDEPLAVTANGSACPADDVVIATHNPLVGLEQPGGRDAVPDQAGALYQLRRRRPRAEGARARRAVLGHRRSLSLPARRAAARLRRRRSSAARTTRPGRSPTPPRCYARLERDARRAAARRRGDAPLVRPGDRDARRPAVHRPRWPSISTPPPASPATA